MSPGAPSSRFVGLLATLALAPRLWVALALAREPVWDGHYYHFGAQRIARGLGYSEDVIVRGVSVWKPWCHYPVGYSALLGAFYEILGDGVWVAPLVNAIAGTALSVLSWAIGRRFLSERRARFGGLLVALHPGLVLYTAVVMNEIVSACLALLALYLLQLGGERLRGAVGGGIVLGLGTLVRPTLLLLGPLTAFAAPARWRRSLLLAAVASGVAVASVLPWTWRNCRVMDGCAFVSTNGGWNLAIGAITETGRFTTLRASDGCPVVTGQVQQDRCWAEEGKRRILADPWRWVSLMPKKLAQTFDHESFAVEYLREAAPRAWPEARRVAMRDLTSGARVIAASVGALASVLGVALYVALVDAHPFWLGVPLILTLALLPLPGRPSLGAAGRGLVALIGSTALAHSIFFGDDRYHLVTTPALALLVAAALRRPAPPAAKV
jgi:4-amino-4-deoxy-L-arabinose transferase-like glycosyltransferase